MKIRKLFFLNSLILLLALSACLAPGQVKENSLLLNSKYGSSNRVVIMPFHNQTQQEAIELKTRKSFYNHFSSKNFYDIELYEIDNSINSLEKLYLKPWTDIPSSELGKFFNADFIIYGDVKIFRRIFLVLYSQMTLSIEIKMVDGMSGDTIYSETIVESLYCGDIPFTFLSILPASIRTGLNMKEKRIIDLADKVSRTFAEQIPEPSYFPEEFVCVNVQAASFLEKNRAVQTIA